MPHCVNIGEPVSKRATIEAVTRQSLFPPALVLFVDLAAHKPDKLERCDFHDKPAACGALVRPVWTIRLVNCVDLFLFHRWIAFRLFLFAGMVPMQPRAVMGTGLGWSYASFERALRISLLPPLRFIAKLPVFMADIPPIEPPSVPQSEPGEVRGRHSRTE